MIRPAADQVLTCSLLDVIGDGVLVVDDALTIADGNPSASRLLGGPPRLAGLGLDALVRDSGRIAQLVAASGGDWRTMTVAPILVPDTLLLSAQRRADGSTAVVLRRLLGGGSGEMIAFATLDPVTRLLNRPAFVARLAATLAALPAAGEACLLCIDVDRFKLVNEGLGYAQGDVLLRCVAQRLRAALPADAAIARVSADEFAVLLPAGDARAAGAAAAAAIRRAMAAPFAAAGDYPLTVSIGTSVWPADGDTSDALLISAEAAMNAAKAEGGDAVRMFDALLLATVREEMELGGRMRRALAQQAFSLAFQPKVDWPSRRLVGFEALLRWTDPEHGDIPPSRFIPVAERSGLIVPLGRWVLAEACRQLARWRDQGLALVPVAVNVSPLQLIADSLDGLLAPIRGNAIPPELVEIEITETALMDQLCRAGRLLDALRLAGIRTAIDDFGTGHSSLSSLRRLPISTFKIDRSFVEDIETCGNARDIVATIIAMAKTLSLEVVAEGVETERQAEFLRDKGARVMQGYLFAAPLSAAAATAWLERTGRP